MSSSDTQRSSPQNALQRRLSSSSPPAAEDGTTSNEPALPEWRSPRFAALAAAEASEYAKPEPGPSGPTVIARVGSRAASGAIHGLTSASVGTLRAGLFTTEALGNAVLRLLDALGGAVIVLAAAVGRGSLAAVRGSGHALFVLGSTLWSQRRRLSFGLGALVVAAGAFVAYRSYAPAGKAAVTSRSARFQAQMIDFGAGLHHGMADLGLTEPIPEAADKPVPPIHVPRYVLEIATLPAGATASFAGQERSTPATFELDVLPEPPLRVTIRKPGLAPVERDLIAADFVGDGTRLRYAVHLTLHAVSARAAPEESPAAERPAPRRVPSAPPAAVPPAAAPPAAAPPAAAPPLVPARSGPTPLVPRISAPVDDVPTAPF